MSLEILFLITARSDSKGVPGKNLKKIGGLSLTAFKARSAGKSKYCSRLVISSDSRQIQEEGAAHGAEVHFTRPAELAIDSALSDDVVLHALNYFESEEGRSYDAVMLLEPASPFARGQDYDAAVEIFLREAAGLVVGVRETEVNSIFVGLLGAGGNMAEIINGFAHLSDTRRQALVPEYTMNGALYLIDTKILKRTRKIYGDPDNTYGLPMDPYHSLEIETPFDLRFAEFLVESGEIDIRDWR